MKKIHIKCPICSFEFDKEYVNPIFEDSKLKSKIMDLTIFNHTCPNCNKEFIGSYPFIYLDKKNKFMILVDRNLKLEKNKKDFNKSLQIYSKTALKGYIIRMTESLNGLKEKIQIFESGYLDKAIEITKVLLLKSKDFQIYNDNNLKNVSFTKIDNKDKLVFTRIEGKFALDFPKELYNEILEKYNGYFKEEKAQEINLEWANNFIEKI